ncbi:GMC oxidoreductase [Azospirillum doebereinerae]|uniref:GMC family oxidoreductase n=1 Tax=Azospirillum doebereinerae TaxID=92933 RepID=A0A3S0V5K1_9PROT|nr:GMC oxidoreductase [Azospirillum doebereinerae]RUQ68816.1 GMC family oxidoreductase [Azospirillum doebereinerae]
MNGRKIGIVGSGPSGAAVAHRFVEAGFDVTVIDVGFEIEPHLAPFTQADHAVDRDRFMEAVTAQRKSVVGETAVLPPKLPFGSDFVYRSIPPNRLSSGAGLHVETSLALGGLSNAWGANVCAVSQRDMADWPFPAGDLTPHFAELDAILDVSGDAGDGIDELYDARLDARPNYPLGLHGQRILAGVARGRERLAAAGLRCGRAKIAVGPKHSVGGMGCTSCGLCMHGCPHRAIFNAADVIRSLSGRPNFRYLGGRHVLRYAEGPDGVAAVCRPADGGPREEHRFDRLFVACGVMGSTAIVARSQGLCDRDFIIHDSQKYYFPYLRYRRVKGAVDERANTLAQVYIQDVGLRSTPHTLHCQLYGVNDLFFESLKAKLGALAHPLMRLGTPMFERMMIGMVYFHSNDSGTLRYRVSANEEDGIGHVEAGPRPDTRPIFKEFMGRLGRFGGVFGGRPLPFLAESSPPGHSLHFGGSLPMARAPEPGQTDVLGRPFGSGRVHVVDTSVLPSIPGTPTTYTVMANALRICAGVLKGAA